MARLKLSINGTTAVPESGNVALYAKPDRRLYFQTDAALEKPLVLEGDITPGFQPPEYRTLTAGEIAAGTLTLAVAPSEPTLTLMDIRGGPCGLWYGLDFEVVGDQLTWSGTDLDGLLEAGDMVRIVYV